MAALNIEGATLHSALRLPVEDGHSHAVATYKYKPLQGDTLQDMQQALRGVRYLIIDEISMVSSNLMNASTFTRDNWQAGGSLGGLSVIAAGDFYQLPPVKAPFVFHSPGGIWCKEFKSKLPSK